MLAIKDSKMPKNCYECDFYSNEYGCRLKFTEECNPSIERAKDCPLVEIEERKQGQWEQDKLFGECAYVCSFCHTIWTSSEIENMHYCPTCGAEMRGTENG